MMSVSCLDLFWKCPFFLFFSFSHSMLRYCCCQLVILMLFAASLNLKVSRIAIGQAYTVCLLLSIQQQGQVATKQLLGIDFQYQWRPHRFIFTVQSVISRFLEMLNAILNIFLSCWVHEYARCLLVCAYHVCTHIHVYVLLLRSLQDAGFILPWSEDHHSSPVFRKQDGTVMSW